MPFGIWKAGKSYADVNTVTNISSSRRGTPNPYQPYDGMSCKEYHAQHPKHTDRVSELFKRAYKRQYKYLSDRDLLSSNILPVWNDELKKRERIARDKWSATELEDFIENTRFSKIGVDVTDYSSY